MLTQRWPPTHRLLLARFPADLKQLQNRNFWTSNRSKPIRVLTLAKPSCSDDGLPIGYLLRNFQPNRSNFFSAHPSIRHLPNRKKRVDTKGKNHAHKTFDSTEASWYHQGSFSLILEKFEQIYDPLWGRRKTRSKITLKSFYSLKEFWHQASHLCIWKPMAWSSFVLTEFIYIGQLLGRKKTVKINLASKPIP